MCAIGQIILLNDLYLGYIGQVAILLNWVPTFGGVAYFSDHSVADVIQMKMLCIVRDANADVFADTRFL